MKGLDVLKRFLIACSLTFGLLHADALEKILSENQEGIFEYDIESNKIQSEKLSNSWLNPIQVEYQKSYTTQMGSDSVGTGTFSVRINQPIFRFGGIYYGIKYAKASEALNHSKIMLQKRQMIGNAVELLFNMQKNILEQKRLKLLIQNDRLDIAQKKEHYHSGLLDSSFLDQALLKKSQDDVTLMDTKMRYIDLKNQFAILSDKDPMKLKLPKLKFVSKEQYKSKHLGYRVERETVALANYNEKVVLAKYLPTVSLQGQYIDGDLNPLFLSPDSLLKEQYYTYGFSISMPIDFNALRDIEVSKVEKLKAKLNVIEKKKSLYREYDGVAKSIEMIKQKIQLAIQNEALYKRLYTLTKDLEGAGEKTALDVATMQHSLEIKKIDRKIYEIDKQLYLLKLYIGMENVL
jgi:outer membrane protein TolC